MVKVECDGCRAPYQIDDKRIPAAGLMMRCPKCGTNILVKQPGAPPARQYADLPVAVPVENQKTAPLGIPRVQRRAAPPAAPPPPALGGEEDLADLPIAAPAGRGSRPTFGELDLDEPALPEVMRVPRAAAPAPPPAPRKESLAFGEIDLMVDLPETHRTPQAPLAEIEQDEADLPAVRRAPQPSSPSTFEFGIDEADLPLIRSHEEDLPSVPRTGADLPSVRRPPVEPRSRTVPFGDIELPQELPAIDLPSIPEGTSGLPATMEGPRAWRDAPTPRVAPMPRDAPTPRVAPTLRDAPTPREAPQGFGEIDLPLASEEGALPAPAHDSGLPTHSPGGALPTPAQASGLPTHAPGGALPISATATGVPEARRPLRSSPETIGEELSLGPSSGPVSSARGAFDDSDRAIPAALGALVEPAQASKTARSSVGDEVELASEVGPAAAAPLPQRAPLPRFEAPAPKRRGSRRIALAAAVLIAVGGAALSLEPSMGPFGVNFIGDRVSAKKHAEALVALRAAAQADLDEDTAPAAVRALAKAKEAQAEAPRYQPIAAYYAYLALSRSLRFGHRSDDLALAKQLLGGQGAAASDALALATATADAESGQLDKARLAAAAILARSPDDVDAAALAGEIELTQKAPDKALAAWKQAVARRGAKKSARALFGLARAEALAGDRAGAAASARAAIEASPQHVGARILLASQLWQSTEMEMEHEEEALGELKKVTGDQGLRGAASDAEIVAAFTLLGRIHLARSRISLSEQAFAAALKVDPQAVDALIGDGELFYEAGRYAEAGARFEAAMRAEDSNVAAKVGAAKTWLAQERMKDAKDLLKKVREGRMKDPAVNFWLGRVEEALGNKKEAEAAYGEASKGTDASPVIVDAYVALSRLLSGTGRTDEANQKLVEASRRFPDLPALHRAKGELLLQTGRYEEAKEELNVALAKDDDLGTRFKIGVALRRSRSFEEAAKVFDKVASIDKQFPGLALERGLLYEETGQSEMALKMYSEALEKAPNDVDLKLRVGSTQVIAGHPAQAEAILREVVRARPASAEANHFLGRALLVKGTNMTEAMRFLEIAASIDNNRAEYHLYVGWCANETGQSARAETALRRALELDHELGDAYWQLGVWYEAQRATLDALKSLQTAIEKRPSRYEAYATMALCYQDLQRWPEAEEAYRKAIAGNGAVGEWHYRLGKLYASHGNQASAGPELELAVKLSDIPDQKPPGWLLDAHFLLAEALRGKNREQAIVHYRRFLKLAPSGNAYIEEAQKALAALHAEPQP